MDRTRVRLDAFVTGPSFVPLGLFLVAVRFSGPTLTAALGIGGVDTTGLDAAFELFAGILPAILFFLAIVVFASWPGGFRRDPWMAVAGILTLAVLVLWAGQVWTSLRILTGAFAGAILDGTVAATVLAYVILLDRATAPAGLSGLARDGFRALGAGYVLSYVFHAFRFVDYQYAFGLGLPSGLLWLFDYGPVITLSFLSIYFWLEIAARPARAALDWLRTLGPPVAVAGVGVAASQGLGGYIISNALAWGGSYTIFAPTSVSLAIVGFAIGAFLATAWALRESTDRTSWWLVVGGVAIVAFAGILSFGGTLPSLAGIVLGLSCAARGLVEHASPGTTTVVPA